MRTLLMLLLVSVFSPILSAQAMRPFNTTEEFMGYARIRSINNFQNAEQIWKAAYFQAYMDSFAAMSTAYSGLSMVEPTGIDVDGFYRVASVVYHERLLTMPHFKYSTPEWLIIESIKRIGGTPCPPERNVTWCVPVTSQASLGALFGQ